MKGSIQTLAAVATLLIVCSHVTQQQQPVTQCVSRRLTGDSACCGGCIHNEGQGLPSCDKESYLIENNTASCKSDHLFIKECGFRLTSGGVEISNILADVGNDNKSTLQTRVSADTELHPAVVYTNTTHQPATDCSINSLEVYRGRQAVTEICYNGFTLSEEHNGTVIQIDEDTLAYNFTEYIGELFRMNLTCDSQTSCLYFKLKGSTNITSGKFDCLVSGTHPDTECNDTTAEVECLNSTTLRPTPTPPRPTSTPDSTSGTTPPGQNKDFLNIVIGGGGGVVFLIFIILILVTIASCVATRRKKKRIVVPNRRSRQVRSTDYSNHTLPIIPPPENAPLPLPPADEQTSEEVVVEDHIYTTVAEVNHRDKVSSDNPSSTPVNALQLNRQRSATENYTNAATNSRFDTHHYEMSFMSHNDEYDTLNHTGTHPLPPRHLTMAVAAEYSHVNIEPRFKIAANPTTSESLEATAALNPTSEDRPSSEFLGAVVAGSFEETYSLIKTKSLNRNITPPPLPPALNPDDIMEVIIPQGYSYKDDKDPLSLYDIPKNCEGFEEGLYDFPTVAKAKENEDVDAAPIYDLPPGSDNESDNRSSASQDTYVDMQSTTIHQPSPP